LKSEKDFKFILRIFNTNIDGKQKIPYAVRKIRGVGRRFSHVVTLKAGLDPNRRAGDMTDEEIEKIVEIITNPMSKTNLIK
jgi:small subunit ribosomal protein S18e